MLISSFFHPGYVDLVELLNLASTPPGIERSTGMCESRPSSSDNSTQHEQDNENSNADVAYKIGSRAMASIPTAQVFPDGFPADFSILATFRANQNTRSTLFAIYSDEGELVLSLKIGRRMRMFYQGQMSKQTRKIKFGPNLSDGK
jgi:hypothetical protein